MDSDYDLFKDGNFSYYLQTLNLDDDSDVLILSPVHHYYYNFEEIKNVRTLVHTKELNKISDLKKFINNTMHVLSKDSKFIGCFEDNEIHKNVLYKNQIVYWLTHCLDVVIYRSLSRKKIIKLFLKHNFKFIDISEVSGLTYFCVKKD